MMLDSHAHLEDERMDSARVINNMKEDNLAVIINAGTTISNTKAAIDFTKNYGVFAMVGIHPESIDEVEKEEPDVSKAISKIKELAKGCDKVVAVGEIGLEYFYINQDLESGAISAELFDRIKRKQKDYFVRLLKMADELKLPVALHIRDAYEDCIKILTDNLNLLNSGVLFHCYSGDAQFANQMLNLIPNCYFAFGGAITFSNQKGKFKEEKAQIIRSIPRDRLLPETDCPYLTPEPFRGKELNEPKFIKFVYLRFAEILGLTLTETEQLMMANAKRLYKLKIEE